jgi:hypothetical protein
VAKENIYCDLEGKLLVAMVDADPTKVSARNVLTGTVTNGRGPSGTSAFSEWSGVRVPLAP